MPINLKTFKNTLHDAELDSAVITIEDFYLQFFVMDGELQVVHRSAKYAEMNSKLVDDITDTNIVFSLRDYKIQVTHDTVNGCFRVYTHLLNPSTHESVYDQLSGFEITNSSFEMWFNSKWVTRPHKGVVAAMFSDFIEYHIRKGFAL